MQDLPPCWGLDIVCGKGTDFNYGPWADRQRYCVGNPFSSLFPFEIFVKGSMLLRSRVLTSPKHHSAFMHLPGFSSFSLNFLMNPLIFHLLFPNSALLQKFGNDRSKTWMVSSPAYSAAIFSAFFPQCPLGGFCILFNGQLNIVISLILMICISGSLHLQPSFKQKFLPLL